MFHRSARFRGARTKHSRRCWMRSTNCSTAHRAPGAATRAAHGVATRAAATRAAAIGPPSPSRIRRPNPTRAPEVALGAAPANTGASEAWAAALEQQRQHRGGVVRIVLRCFIQRLLVVVSHTTHTTHTAAPLNSTCSSLIAHRHPSRVPFEGFRRRSPSFRPRELLRRLASACPARRLRAQARACGCMPAGSCTGAASADDADDRLAASKNGS